MAIASHHSEVTDDSTRGEENDDGGGRDLPFALTLKFELSEVTTSGFITWSTPVPKQDLPWLLFSQSMVKFSKLLSSDSSIEVVI